MSDSTSRSLQFASRPAALVVAAVVGILIAATLAFWAYYGSVVFYEMILAGVAACF